MNLFHDSRDRAYRTPYGAVTVGTPVKISLDVSEADNPSVTLRTWVEGIGEQRYEMSALSPADSAKAGVPAGATRYQATLTPDAAGTIWYHFIVADASGCEKRYGTKDGSFGGVGLMRDWEPPSFMLAVFAAYDEDALTAGEASLDAAVLYLCGKIGAPELVESIETLRESSTAPAYANRLTLLGAGGLDRMMERLADGNPNLSKGRLWCLSLMQLLMPPKPALWMEADGEIPQNPRSLTELPGGCNDADCEAIMANSLDLHRTLPLFSQARCECFAANDDVFGFWRRDDEGNTACVLVNASLRNAHDIAVPLVDEAVSEVIAGYGVPIVSSDELEDAPVHAPDGMAAADSYALVHLYQLGSAILLFHPAQRLQSPMEPGLGVLAHITSLPMEAEAGNGFEPAAPAGEIGDGPADAAVSDDDAEAKMPLNLGTLGTPAHDFVDWLAQAGATYWQVLPANPTDEYGSPYAGISAFAGNTRLLENAKEAVSRKLTKAEQRAYRAFCKREADWLEPYAAFMAIRQKVGAGIVWQDWPAEYRRFDPSLLDADPDLQAQAETWRRAQFAFQQQWDDLRAYANGKGIQIIGDMPIYVSADSADVWAEPRIFQLGEDGKPAVVAGCPADAFAVEGQVWGNPIYDWDVLAADGYSWWLRRLKRSFELYDIVRLDHFIGFERYFAIPEGEKALLGTYHAGPGLAFFRCVHDAFGPLPIIAEDLGSITPAVRALDAACGFPGMDIVQFVDGNDPLSGYHPRPEKIAYTGTHDNQTLVGYVADRYPGEDATRTARTLMEAVATSSADVCVLPLQDLMGLDDEARMNVPGTSKGNWTWQARQDDMDAALECARRLVELRESKQV